MRKLLQRAIEILDGAPPKPQANQRGQSLVEMTLIMPILLIILLGVIEMGWYAQNILTLTEATRVGARRAPFLNGNYSPQAWNDDASRVPLDIAETDPDYDTDPRVAARGGFVPDGCSQILTTDQGFFNIITCATLDAMDPLVLDWDNDKDDIVVSVFAIQRVKIGATGSDDINPSARGSTTGYSNGTQVVIVGRYPPRANECYLWGERDPFDWIENGDVDWANVGGTNVPYEIAYWSEEDNEFLGYLDDPIDDDAKQVGFSWTGQWRYVDDSENRTDCRGSQWSVEDVQTLANLEDFLVTEESRQYLPSIGLVLVEVFWEHHLIFEDFPAMSAEWSPVYQILGGSDPNTVRDVIRTWAMFPAPAAEPRLVFRPG